MSARVHATLKQKHVLVILPERAFRHGEPVIRRKNKKGEYIPVRIAQGPTQKKGKLNLPPVQGRQPDPTPQWWKESK